MDALIPIATGPSLPSVITEAGERTSYRFTEFFTAQIRNRNTREAYMRAVFTFLDWVDARGLSLKSLNSVAIAAYIESHPGSPPTVKQHLAAIRMLLDYLVTGGVIPFNPAAAVKGPRYSVAIGKTPVLQPEEARRLMASIDTTILSGLRDRALIGVMIYSFARISAVLSMNVEDYYPSGKRFFLRLAEKGGKQHVVPCHHLAEAYLDEYVEAAGIGGERKTPLFRAIAGKTNQVSGERLQRRSALAAVKKRALVAGLAPEICNHTFRATGITAYMLNGGSLESAQRIAAHASSQTTKLYDRSATELTTSEIERIVL